MKPLELVIIIALFALEAWSIRTPEWRTVDMIEVTATDCRPWAVARQYKPDGMPMLDYVERLRSANPRGINAGERCLVPVCEIKGR